METAAWAAIGVVAAISIGTLFYVGTIDAVAARMDARFDAVDGRLDRHAG
ncbi:MAG TPA: hypothetical protein VG709_06325 [Actinomycetota bacterium]|nr:hypothetical protein [Actinomycetota bacterium]